MKKSLLLGFILILSGSVASAVSSAQGCLKSFSANTAAVENRPNMRIVSEEGTAGKAFISEKGKESASVKYEMAPVAGVRGPRQLSLSGASVYGWLAANGEDVPGGWYSLDTDGTYKMQWTSPVDDAFMNMLTGWVKGDKLCGTMSYNLNGMVFSYNYIEYDLKSGRVLSTDVIGKELDLSLYFTSSVYVPEEDKVYGYAYSNSGATAMRFASAPVSDLTDLTTIKDLDDRTTRTTALCYNQEEGVFYGVTFDDNFVRIDKEGNQTVLFSTGLDGVKTDPSGLVYSPLDGCYIYTPVFYKYCSQMYYIYPEKNEMRFICNFPSDLEFYYLLDLSSSSLNYNPAAPARPVLDNDRIAPGATSGTLEYIMPSESGNGQTLTGNLNWILYLDNVSFSTGTAAPGSKVSVEFTDIAEGEHVFRMVALSGGLEGQSCVLSKYIGNGVPFPPESVTLDKTTISWDAVDKAELNGYLDLANIEYEVYLNDKLLGTTSSTSMPTSLDPNAEMAYYYAYVKTVCHGKKSEATQSNKLIFGAPIELPYFVTPTQSEADLCTYINADGGPAYGEWDFSEARWHEPVFFSGWSNDPADDWLILPAVACDDLSHAYRITLDAICGGTTGDDERFEVWCGPEPTVEAMNTLIIPETQVNKFITEGWETFTNLFVPKQSGPCYIAIRAVSPPGQYSLLIRKINIEVTDEVADVPMAPTEVAIVDSSDADLTATVSMVLPTMTIGGNVIPATADMKGVVKVGEKVTEVSGTPGQKIQIVADTYQGDNRLDVYCVVNGQSGQHASVNIFTGTIPPNFVENFKYEITRDNMGVKMSWEPPVRGQENLEGYYSPEGMHYWVMEVVEGEYGQEWQPTIDLGNVTEYTFTFPEGTKLGMYYVAIVAANNGGISQALSYVYACFGEPYKPIVDENFVVNRNFGLNYEPLRIFSGGSFAAVSWDFVRPEDVSPDFWNQNIPYATIAYTTDLENGSGTGCMILPKMSSEGLEQPILTLPLWTGAYSGELAVMARTYGDDDYQEIAKMTHSGGWDNLYVKFPEKFHNMPWIEIALYATCADPQKYVLVGGYKFSDIKDSGVGSVTLNDGRISGGTGEIVVTGFEGVDLDIYAPDGKLVKKSVRINGDTHVSVPKGIYIVACGDTRAKVMVK